MLRKPAALSAACSRRGACKSSVARRLSTRMRSSGSNARLGEESMTRPSRNLPCLSPPSIPRRSLSPRSWQTCPDIPTS
ncbi:hypothetical protein VTK56DRAFT_1926 [Thermocarpiscus australiensis]